MSADFSADGILFAMVYRIRDNYAKDAIHLTISVLNLYECSEYI